MVEARDRALNEIATLKEDFIETFIRNGRR